MKRCLVMVAVLGMLCLTAGCNSAQQHEALVDEIVQLFQELATIMEGINDEQTAGAAVPKLDALNARFELAFQRYVALPEISEEENKRLGQKVEAALKGLDPRMKKAGFNAGMKAGKSGEAFKGAFMRVMKTLEKFPKFDQRQKQQRR